MSTYQSFPDLPAAQAAFAAGLCRRHVRVDGHVIDLVQARDEAGRAREEPIVGRLVGSFSLMYVSASGALAPVSVPPDCEAHDRGVERAIAEELARAAAPEVLPALAVPEVATVDLCRACGRPMIGEVA